MTESVMIVGQVPKVRKIEAAERVLLTLLFLKMRREKKLLIASVKRDLKSQPYVRLDRHQKQLEIATQARLSAGSLT